MASWDVVFLPSQASFFTTFHQNCGTVYVLEMTTCLNRIVHVNKGMLAVKMFSPTNPLSCGIQMSLS